ncbi:NETI motif-containing protein [Sporosarcina sp. G11-34]|uniref:NETI motif-containing protein n=1 Tax=Sporosarcina sp. G11-34 TaxID=2849605 RepID=UPI0022A98FD8|nr:NETI motif-containing protein [Sporosarcina sp. G11-34]MCZ2260171.1 NETI motif-containing protein [Sporosarcina sp. G11-34]
MSQKKTVWFEVEEKETIENCLKRIADEGYLVAGRKEEPLFAEVNGEYVPIRQLIKFKGILIEGNI